MSIKMKKVILGSLHCSKTEDYGTDECKLVLYKNGSKITEWNQDVNEGGDLNLNNYELTFADSDKVTLKLWDKDWPDSDDFLGEVEIDHGVANSHTGSFTKDGADYTVSYQVDEVFEGNVLSINYLKCNVTEDCGSDECLIRLYKNTQEIEHWKNDMDAGNTYRIDKKYDMSETDHLSMKLWDEDWPDSDDFLGEVEFDKTTGNDKVGYFTKDGANYEIHYDISLNN